MGFYFLCLGVCGQALAAPVKEGKVSIGGLYSQVSGGQGIPLCIRWKWAFASVPDATLSSAIVRNGVSHCQRKVSDEWKKY